MVDISALLSLKPASPAIDLGLSSDMEALETNAFSSILSIQLETQTPAPPDIEAALPDLATLVVTTDQAGKRQPGGKILPDALPDAPGLTPEDPSASEPHTIKPLDRLLADRAELQAKPGVTQKAKAIEPKQAKRQAEAPTPDVEVEANADTAFATDAQPASKPSETAIALPQTVSLIALATAIVETPAATPAREEKPAEAAFHLSAPAVAIKAPEKAEAHSSQMVTTQMGTMKSASQVTAEAMILQSTPTAPAVASATPQPAIVVSAATFVAMTQVALTTADQPEFIVPIKVEDAVFTSPVAVAQPAAIVTTAQLPTEIVLPRMVTPGRTPVPVDSAVVVPTVATPAAAFPSVSVSATAKLGAPATTVAKPVTESAAVSPSATAPSAQSSAETTVSTPAQNLAKPSSPPATTSPANALAVANAGVAIEAAIVPTETASAEPSTARPAAARPRTAAVQTPVRSDEAASPAAKAEAAPATVAERATPAAPQPALLAEARQPVVGPAAATVTTALPEATQDFAALVDRLIAARQTAAPQAVQATVAHSQFGRVNLDFRQDGGELTVAMTSADPTFAPAVMAALASEKAAPVAETNRQNQPDTQVQAQVAVQQSGQAQAQTSQQQPQGQQQQNQQGGSSATLQQGNPGQSGSEGRSGAQERGQQQSGRFQPNPSPAARDDRSSQTRKGTYA